MYMLYHGTSAILDLYDRARGRGHINQYCTSARDITNLSRMKPYFWCFVYVRMRKHHVFPLERLKLSPGGLLKIRLHRRIYKSLSVLTVNGERQRISEQEKKTLALVERSAPILYCF